MTKPYNWEVDSKTGKKKTGRPVLWDARSLEEIKQEKKIEKYIKKKLSVNKDIIIKNLISKWLGTNKKYKDNKERRKDIVQKIQNDEDLSFFTNESISSELEETLDLEYFLPSLVQGESDCIHEDIFDYVDKNILQSKCRCCSRIKKWSIGEWDLYIESQTKKVLQNVN